MALKKQVPPHLIFQNSLMKVQGSPYIIFAQFRFSAYSTRIDLSSFDQHACDNFPFQVLTMKELVGMCNKSHGLMCSEGAIYYSHNGQQEHIVTLPALPLSITLSVRCHHSNYTILTYKLAPSGECTSLVGRKILTDAKLKDAVLPVFSVSQRVKLLFPTFV